MPNKEIDPTTIHPYPLAERRNDLSIEQIAYDLSANPPAISEALARRLDVLAERVAAAKRAGASVMLTYGAHLIKNGGGPLVNALLEGGWITHIATQGAGIIHDWEFAYLGQTSESVRDNAPVGRFGTWDETGRAINLAALVGGAMGLGLGEAMGKFINEDGLELPEPTMLEKQIADAPDDSRTAGRADLLAAMKTHDLQAGRWNMSHPHKSCSVPACCYRLGVPFSVLPGIGYDIYATHPLYSAAAIGRGAGVDFRRLVSSVDGLDGGVYLSVGSAIMSPQVFEKAFSMANNIRQTQGRPFLSDHAIAVVDIADGGNWDWAAGEPPKDHPAYYLRFCKSFYRMGGLLDYLRGDNIAVLGNLLARLKG